MKQTLFFLVILIASCKKNISDNELVGDWKLVKVHLFLSPPYFPGLNSKTQLHITSSRYQRSFNDSLVFDQPYRLAHQTLDSAKVITTIVFEDLNYSPPYYFLSDTLVTPVMGITTDGGVEYFLR